MALDPHQILQGGAPLDEAALPLAGTRRQRMQRLQVGLAGIGAIVLMVGLADIIISSVQENQAALPEAMPPATTEDVPAPRDPLANAGVVPELGEGEGEGAATDPAASPVATPATPAN